MPRKIKPLDGARFGEWLVIGEGEMQVGKARNRTLRCQCSCGSVKDIQAGRLKLGNSKSCGCKSAQYVSEAFTRHGLTGSPPYEAIRHARARCFNPKDRAYANYGGRGITVCPEWLGDDGAVRFVEWSLANGYAKGLTLDRINNDMGYSPNNCRWVTYQKNLNNRRNTVYVEYRGERLPLSECWQRYGGNMPYSRLYSRYRSGVPIDKALR
jgi:hypothetical protein